MLFDFKCPRCRRVFEDMIKPHVYATPCIKCHANADRQVSAPRIDKTALALTKGASPESIAHFDRIHRERKAIDDRKLAEHGSY